MTESKLVNFFFYLLLELEFKYSYGMKFSWKLRNKMSDIDFLFFFKNTNSQIKQASNWERSFARDRIEKNRRLRKWKFIINENSQNFYYEQLSARKREKENTENKIYNKRREEIPQTLQINIISFSTISNFNLKLSLHIDANLESRWGFLEAMEERANIRLCHVLFK